MKPVEKLVVESKKVSLEQSVFMSLLFLHAPRGVGTLARLPQTRSIDRRGSTGNMIGKDHTVNRLIPVAKVSPAMLAKLLHRGWMRLHTFPALASYWNLEDLSLP